MAAGVGDGVVEGVEEVPFVGEVVEWSDGVEDPSVAGASTVEEDGDASRFEFRDDLAERLRTGRVEDLDMGEAQDHDLTSVIAVSSVRNRCAAPKKSAPSRRYTTMCSWSSRASSASVTMSSSVERLGVGFAVTGHVAQREDDGDGDPDLDRDDEVERDRGAAVSTSTRASERVECRTARTLWMSTMRTAVTISTPASAANGILATRSTAEVHDRDQHERVDDGGEPCPGAGSDVDRRACDRAGRRHAAEQRRREVRETLAEQLAVGFVAAGVAHAVGDSADSRLSIAASRATAIAAPNRSLTWSNEVGQRRKRQRVGSEPMVAIVERRRLGDDRGDDDRQQRGGQRSTQPRPDHHQCHDEQHDPDRRPLSGVERVDDGSRRDEGRVLALGLGDTERGRDLLQEDDRRDADGEPLDDRPRDVRQERPRPTNAGDDDQHAGHDRHHVHGVGAVAVRRSAPSTTVIAPVGPETWTFDPPNTPATSPATIAVIRPGLGAEPGRDPERQRQRQRHDAHGQPGDHVALQPERTPA